MMIFIVDGLVSIQGYQLDFRNLYAGDMMLDGLAYKAWFWFRIGRICLGSISKHY